MEWISISRMKKTTLQTEAKKLKGIIDILLEDDGMEDHRAFMGSREDMKDKPTDDNTHRIQTDILNYVHSKIGMTETVEDEYKFLRVMLRLVKIEKDEAKRVVMVKLIRESLETLFQDSKISDMINIS